MALFINGVGQDTFNMNGVSIDNLYVDGVLVWSSALPPENTKPVISIIGDNPMYLVLNGSAYVEQGATATDAEDGDITSDIVIGGDTPDVSVEGYYYVTYNVSDSEGLAANEAVRTVSVYVVTVPKYELTEELTNDGTFDYVPDSNNPNSSFIGKLTESDGTTPYLPTELQYPQNGLLELASGRIMDTQFNALTNRTAMYGIYGSDGSTVYNIWALEYISLDFYNLYEGDQDTPLAITVSSTPIFPPDESIKVTDERPSWLPSLDVTKPVITMLGTSPVDVENGAVYTDAGATALDDVDGDITADIVTVNNVDTDTDGSYDVTYDVDDSAGNSADTVTRVVNVATTAVFVPIWIAFNNNAIVSTPPNGETVNAYNRTYDDLTTVHALVDIDNVASGCSYQLTDNFENGYTGAISGNNGYCHPDVLTEDCWQTNDGSNSSGAMQFTLPAGTYTISVGSFSNQADSSVGEFIMNGETLTVDGSLNNGGCAEFVGVVSDGATPIPLQVSSYSTNYYSKITSVIIQRTA